MGQEGAAAIAYFQGLAQIIAPRWGFCGRNRGPPRDPVNALLSLCYTLAAQTILRTLQRKGFDPALGFLHPPEAGRHSLVLDALEPIRPEIDRFVLQLLEHPLT
jgi:CRISPR-associated protein Cas1